MKKLLIWKDTKERYIFKDQIVGYFAMWTIRQSPYDMPDKFITSIQEFTEAIDQNIEFDTLGMCKTTCRDLKRSICNTIKLCPTVLTWSEPKNPSTSEYLFVSRHDAPAADDDFIDVFALSRNVAYGCWLELCYDDNFFEA
jgi:hypothetical protein